MGFLNDLFGSGVTFGNGAFNGGSSFVNKPQTPASTQTPAPASVQKNDSIYDDQMENLINLAIEDGEISEDERRVLYRKAEAKGIDIDELDMVLASRLKAQQKKLKAEETAAQPITGSTTTNKYGDIKKCPACGAQIQSFTTRCPECGYEFHNLEANASIQRLFEMLNEVEQKENQPTNVLGTLNSFLEEQEEKKLKQKKEIIKNFPVPNTKEDLIEFMTLAVPLAKKKGGFFSADDYKDHNDLIETWKSKCEQIIMKAKFSMKDDPKTLEEILAYGRELGIK